MSSLTGLPVDLGLIRAGLVSVMAAADHHSFHEVMAGAQLSLEEVAHPGSRTTRTTGTGTGTSIR